MKHTKAILDFLAPKKQRTYIKLSTTVMYDVQNKNLKILKIIVRAIYY